MYEDCGTNIRMQEKGQATKKMARRNRNTVDTGISILLEHLQKLRIEMVGRSPEVGHDVMAIG